MNWILLILLFTACKKTEIKEPFNFKKGTFLIDAGENFDKTLIYRKDSLQIEHYQNRVDTLIIKWKNNFFYTLKMQSPQTELDKKTIFVKITKIYKGRYECVVKIELSNFTQKATIKKIKHN